MEGNWSRLFLHNFCISILPEFSYWQKLSVGGCIALVDWWCSCEGSLGGISPTCRLLPAVTGVRDFLCTALLCPLPMLLCVLYSFHWHQIICNTRSSVDESYSMPQYHLTALLFLLSSSSTTAQSGHGLFCYSICLWHWCWHSIQLGHRPVTVHCISVK